MAQGFKTLIFLTIPLNVFVVVVVCVGLATQHWVEGINDNGNETKIEFNFGFFSGSKTKTAFSSIDFDLNSDVIF